jgi:hypothetical protein
MANIIQDGSRLRRLETPRELRILVALRFVCAASIRTRIRPDGWERYKNEATSVQ